MQDWWGIVVHCTTPASASSATPARDPTPLQPSLSHGNQRDRRQRWYISADRSSTSPALAHLSAITGCSWQRLEEREVDEKKDRTVMPFLNFSRSQLDNSGYGWKTRWYGANLLNYISSFVLAWSSSNRKLRFPDKSNKKLGWNLVETGNSCWNGLEQVKFYTDWTDSNFLTSYKWAPASSSFHTSVFSTM